MILSAIIYIERDGKYLMLHRTRKVNDVNKDKWIGVGGKFEEGETPEECARRETYEETGLTLENLFYRGIITFTSNEAPAEQMHVFLSSAFSGEIKDCDEGELDWIEKEKLLSLPIWEGDKIFLRLLDKPIP
ncbi:MAG: 8-oxo-dGTP diphosphatase, partial [Clostridia bacterium]|nr:8-oxo-dGTP diphosphatase [Clostridia bacterium]